MEQHFQTTLIFAQELDRHDPLSKYGHYFHFPKDAHGNRCLYFCGHSLGLSPKSAQSYVEQELQAWHQWGVDGHFKASMPWVAYHENLTEPVAQIVGATPLEVVVMNSLTVNLHLLLVSFYRPTPQRYKIVMEANAFPSDQYAVQSQLRYHNIPIEQGLIELRPRVGEDVIRHEDIEALLHKQGEEIALIMLGAVNYYTGQAFDIEALTPIAHAKGCLVGLDLAHAAGNLLLRLHDWEVDFAVWCSYKYLNGGPGSVGGCFVHEHYAYRFDLPRFCGWWGHDKINRFQMKPYFKAMPGAEGWQLSTPPIFQLAALRASIDIFQEAGMQHLRQKSEQLTGYLTFLLKTFLSHKMTLITPEDPQQRGSQLSLRILSKDKSLVEKLARRGVICDWREPDILRIAPVPFYTRFVDIYQLVEILKEEYVEI